jgi:hypothetical protein
MAVSTYTKAGLNVLTLILAGGVLASCKGGGDVDAKQQEEMTKGFSTRPPISQLPLAQKQRAEDMRKMAEQMAHSGPPGAKPTGGN